ncbi:conserved hypothetical protein [Histoplasma capsulatum var. duboisii H88]|uniref:Kinetochore protein mis14 n=1 Tax=Ajellomyces capsulatus (strain H88) TaxID=544711 RepID=F0U681_AJEC8|nr:conserved hypothetical protein [Histoplasma capsulatum var. duboisii H88]QSS51327.1 kinetochore protein mis14 [Histoplasma capsulatum var. duboisii H88]
METPHHRKIELQSPADLSYLYANTVALSRQKLDLHFPPSATPNHVSSAQDNPSNPDPDSDPMKSHVRSLVDEFIHKTFLTAAPSISINGLSPADAAAVGNDNHNNSHGPTDPLSFLHVREAVEYEPYDTALGARVASLYAQLESLTMTVAQLRRDTPRRAAEAYAEALRGVLKEEDEDWEVDGEGDGNGDYGDDGGNGGGNRDGPDVDMKDLDGETTQLRRRERRQGYRNRKEDFTLHVPFGHTEGMKRRWVEGGVADVYADALTTLVRLQGEAAGVGDVHDCGDEDGDGSGSGSGSGGQRGLATTVGKVERARRAAEVVENL